MTRKVLLLEVKLRIDPKRVSIEKQSITSQEVSREKLKCFGNEIRQEKVGEQHNEKNQTTKLSRARGETKKFWNGFISKCWYAPPLQIKRREDEYIEPFSYFTGIQVDAQRRPF